MLLSYGADIISTASFYSLVQLIKIHLSEILYLPLHKKRRNETKEINTSNLQK